MPTDRVPRQTLITQSLQDYVSAALTSRGYPVGTQVEVQDSFDQSQFDAEIDHEYVCLGFNFDPGGVPFEIGSNLRRYSHRLEVFVIARNADAGESIGHALRERLEGDGLLPLKNYLAPGNPVIDQLCIDPVRIEHQPIPDPRPWQRFIWLLTIPAIDEFDPTTA